MNKKLLLAFILATLSNLAQAQEVTCKTEFNMAPYKKNIFGKLVRDHEGKFNNSVVVGTMRVQMPLNEDRSAYFTYSSHDDGSNRITTYYKAQPNAQGTVNVSMNFYIKGKESAPQVDVVLDGERSDVIELEKPVLWKQGRESSTMIESIYYSCKLR